MYIYIHTRYQIVSILLGPPPKRVTRRFRRMQNWLIYVMEDQKRAGTGRHNISIIMRGAPPLSAMERRRRTRTRTWEGEEWRKWVWHKPSFGWWAAYDIDRRVSMKNFSPSPLFSRVRFASLRSKLGFSSRLIKIELFLRLCHPSYHVFFFRFLIVFRSFEYNRIFI